MTNLLYFATGDGANASGEAYAAPASKLYSIQPVSATTLDLIFDSKDENIPTRFDYIRLTITSNTHQNVIASIGQVISRNSGGSLITVCDADNSIFLNSNITDCVIYLNKSNLKFYTQNITGTAKAEVTTANGSFDSLLLTSAHDSTDAVVNLYVASQVGTAITNSTVLAAETEAASGSSVTLTVDTVSATDDLFLNEQVWKSDGTLFGTCTAVNSTTEIVFGGGLSSAITDNDPLYTGTRYHILKAVEVEVGSTLKLEPDEVNFDNDNYKLYITLTAGSIDIITRQ